MDKKLPFDSNCLTRYTVDRPRSALCTKISIGRVLFLKIQAHIKLQTNAPEVEATQSNRFAKIKIHMFKDLDLDSGFNRVYRQKETTLLNSNLESIWNPHLDLDLVFTSNF